MEGREDREGRRRQAGQAAKGTGTKQGRQGSCEPATQPQPNPASAGQNWRTHLGGVAFDRAIVAPGVVVPRLAKALAHVVGATVSAVRPLAAAVRPAQAVTCDDVPLALAVEDGHAERAQLVAQPVGALEVPRPLGAHAL